MVFDPRRTRSLRNMRITSKGFQFLLEDVNTQLWDLLLVYLEESQVSFRRFVPAGPRLISTVDVQDLVQTIGFLFMLGSLELGRVRRVLLAATQPRLTPSPQAYMTDNLSQIQHGVLRDLADYGLVYLPEVSRPRQIRFAVYEADPRGHQRNAPIFYPTRLATTLTSSAPPLVSSRHSNEEKGFIVLETNYKLYAYTSNPLQIAVLGLFAHLKTRFANFVTGHITRESIRRGLANGITANQVSRNFRPCTISVAHLESPADHLVSRLTRAPTDACTGRFRRQAPAHHGRRPDPAVGARAPADPDVRRLPLRRIFVDARLRARCQLCERDWGRVARLAQGEEGLCHGGRASANSVRVPTLRRSLPSRTDFLLFVASSSSVGWRRRRQKRRRGRGRSRHEERGGSRLSTLSQTVLPTCVACSMRNAFFAPFHAIFAVNCETLPRRAQRKLAETSCSTFALAAGCC